MSNYADYDEKKIFVGGLTRSTPEEVLRNFYKAFGDVADVFISKDLSTGVSRGFGFVTFKTKQAVDDCLANLPHEIDGKVVDAKKATPRVPKGVGMPTPPIPSNSSAPAKKIFVGGIPINATSEDLQQYFSQYGPVEEVDLLVDRNTGKRRGFGFVSFSFMETVEKLCALHFVEINGKKVEIKQAETRPGPGAGRGRGGGFMGMSGRGRGFAGRGGGFSGGDFRFSGPPGPFGRGHPGQHGAPHPGNYGQMHPGPVPMGPGNGGRMPFGTQAPAQSPSFVGGSQGPPPTAAAVGGYGPGMGGGNYAAGAVGGYVNSASGSYPGGQPVQGNAYPNQVNLPAGGYRQPTPNSSQAVAYGQQPSGYGYGQPSENAPGLAGAPGGAPAASQVAAPAASGFVGQSVQANPQGQYGTVPGAVSYGQPSTAGYGAQAVGATTAYAGHAAASGTSAGYSSEQVPRGGENPAAAAAAVGSIQGQAATGAGYPSAAAAGTGTGYGSAATVGYNVANSGFGVAQPATPTSTGGYSYVPGVGYQQQLYAQQAANKAYGMPGAAQTSGVVPGPANGAVPAPSANAAGYAAPDLGGSYQQVASNYAPQRPAASQVANHGFAPY